MERERKEESIRNSKVRTSIRAATVGGRTSLRFLMQSPEQKIERTKLGRKVRASLIECVFISFFGITIHAWPHMEAPSETHSL